MEDDQLKTLAREARQDSYRNHRVATVADILAARREGRSEADCWHAVPPLKCKSAGKSERAAPKAPRHPPLTDEEKLIILTSQETNAVLARSLGVSLDRVSIFRRQHGVALPPGKRPSKK